MSIFRGCLKSCKKDFCWFPWGFECDGLEGVKALIKTLRGDINDRLDRQHEAAPAGVVFGGWFSHDLERRGFHNHGDVFVNPP